MAFQLIEIILRDTLDDVSKENLRNPLRLWSLWGSYRIWHASIRIRIPVGALCTSTVPWNDLQIMRYAFLSTQTGLYLWYPVSKVQSPPDWLKETKIPWRLLDVWDQLGFPGTLMSSSTSIIWLTHQTFYSIQFLIVIQHYVTIRKYKNFGFINDNLIYDTIQRKDQLSSAEWMRNKITNRLAEKWLNFIEYPARKRCWWSSSRRGMIG